MKSKIAKTIVTMAVAVLAAGTTVTTAQAAENTPVQQTWCTLTEAATWTASVQSAATVTAPTGVIRTVTTVLTMRRILITEADPDIIPEEDITIKKKRPVGLYRHIRPGRHDCGRAKRQRSFPALRPSDLYQRSLLHGGSAPAQYVLWQIQNLSGAFTV